VGNKNNEDENDNLISICKLTNMVTKKKKE
jgi:hypothetical protein